MVYQYVICLVLFASSINCDEELSEQEIEDRSVVNETLAKYGGVRNLTSLSLPGPELRADLEKDSLKDVFDFNENNYTIRIRSMFETFSYNSRYEEGKLIKSQNQTVPLIKGQFGEYFERKSGGYYIRTIGYTSDENGYQQFLIDLSIAHIPNPLLRISGTVLQSLIGGNSLG